MKIIQKRIKIKIEMIKIVIKLYHLTVDLHKKLQNNNYLTIKSNGVFLKTILTLILINMMTIIN